MRSLAALLESGYASLMRSILRPIRAVLFALATIALAPAAAHAQDPCRRVSYAGSDFSVCTFDLRRYRIETFLRAPDGEPYGALDKLVRASEGAKLVAAMNAGMYQPDLSPAGLYVEKGRLVKPANTARGKGN